MMFVPRRRGTRGRRQWTVTLLCRWNIQCRGRRILYNVHLFRPEQHLLHFDRVRSELLGLTSLAAAIGLAL